MVKEYDFLVIGSGIAGLSFALKVAQHGRVAIVTKTLLTETNTSYAQGGISSVMYAPDSLENHIHDTLVAGDGMCDLAAVEKVVHEAPAIIAELVKLGTQFDKQADGQFDLHREGGHSDNRILHHKDNTGAEIQRALTLAIRQNSQIDIYEHHFAVDVITPHHLGKVTEPWMTNIVCYGAYVLDKASGKLHTFLAKTTLLATGGIGSVYQTTTNPLIATGDGIAMAFRAKGIIENMEFVQFHPTSLFNPAERPSFLITEAMRGFGGILRRQDGSEFMLGYDPRGCLAPRDIVARAIDNEMKNRGEDFVYLDVTHKSADEIKNHFPTIYEKCLSLGLDITKQMIPVVPAAHYGCGGIKVDLNGRSSIINLYAAGECASTGLHGANRLASNSLTEGVVYANAAASHAIEAVKSATYNHNIPVWNDEGTQHPEEMVLITQSNKEVEQIMSNYVGIVRSNLRLNRAFDRLEVLYHETEMLYQKSAVSQRICELRNKINVGYLIIKMAKKRKESRGLHYNVDFPGRIED